MSTIDWLLEGPAWLKYAAELQLLGLAPDPTAALADPAVRRLSERLRSAESGLPALKAKRISYTRTGNAHWDLFLLADMGLSAASLGIGKDVEDILNMQSADGTFVTERPMASNYFCISAILLSTIARLGYREDGRVTRYVQTLLRLQRDDGGWHCEKSQHGGGMWDPESCPMDNLNILMLVGQYDEYRKDPRFDGAVDLLLHHWECREQKLHLDGFGVGRRFRSLKYPAVDYGILRVLDVLSLFPHAVRSRGFRNMLDFVRAKGRDGRYVPEEASGSFPGFDFDQTQEPSRWLTFLVARIEKRAGL